MGKRNFLVEGVSGSGKTSVATELRRRGHRVVHGDRQLKYVGDPVTGEPLPVPVAFPDVHSRAEWIHRHLCWPVDVVVSLVGNRDEELTLESHAFLNDRTEWDEKGALIYYVWRTAF